LGAAIAAGFPETWLVNGFPNERGKGLNLPFAAAFLAPLEACLDLNDLLDWRGVSKSGVDEEVDEEKKVD
jgi:hypothetical protein